MVRPSSGPVGLRQALVTQQEQLGGTLRESFCWVEEAPPPELDVARAIEAWDEVHPESGDAAEVLRIVRSGGTVRRSGLPGRTCCRTAALEKGQEVAAELQHGRTGQRVTCDVCSAIWRLERTWETW